MMWLSDVRAVLIRNLQRFRSTPEVFVWAVLQPIMFVLLFSQVFGGGIAVEGTNYTNFLMAGIFAQSLLFGATFSGMFTAKDRETGLLDRFATLPVSASAVVTARTLADVLINAVTLTVMIGTGLVVGWRPEAGLGSFVAGVALLLAFSWCFSWVMVWIGARVSSSDTFNNATFMVLFPLTFLSNAFVPSNTLPTALRIFAEWNPVSSLVHATRTLFGNTGDLPAPTAWPLQHALGVTVVGMLLIVLVFAPLATRASSRER